MHATFNNYFILALCSDAIYMRERERDFKFEKKHIVQAWR